MFFSYVLTEDKIGPPVPSRWQDNIKVAKRLSSITKGPKPFMGYKQDSEGVM